MLHAPVLLLAYQWTCVIMHPCMHGQCLPLQNVPCAKYSTPCMALLHAPSMASYYLDPREDVTLLLPLATPNVHCPIV